MYEKPPMDGKEAFSRAAELITAPNLQAEHIEQAKQYLDQSLRWMENTLDATNRFMSKEFKDNETRNDQFQDILGVSEARFDMVATAIQAEMKRKSI